MFGLSYNDDFQEKHWFKTWFAFLYNTSSQDINEKYLGSKCNFFIKIEKRVNHLVKDYFNIKCHLESPKKKRLALDENQ